MPKASNRPKFRSSVKRGKSGQVWTSFWYDMRGTGKPDIPLGNDYDKAVILWTEIHLDGPRIAGTLEEAFKGFEERGIQNRPNGKARSDETISGYRKCLKAMRGALGGGTWHEVTLPVLVAYLDKRTAKERGRQEMQLLSVIWNWARLQGMTTLPFPGADMERSGWKGAPGVREIEVGDEAFAALHKHADQTLRDALDIATATGLRVKDVIALRLSDVRDGHLTVRAGKTAKRAEFDMSASVLTPIIERRRAMRQPEHVFVLAAGRKPVTYRMLSERFNKARAEAAKEVPECKDLWLRDMRKRAGQLSPTLREASTLLQHSSEAVTRRHYRPAQKLTPVR